jgi:hypothetical protein
MALIAHYKLDGNANDSVGGNHGTASNVTWVDGKLGKAGSFTGGNTRHVVTPVVNLAGSLSFSCWCYPFTSSNIGGLVSNHNHGGTANFTMYHSSSKIIVHAGYTDNTRSAGIETSEAIPLNQWTLVTFAYDGNANRGQIYYNGILKRDAVFPKTVKFSPYNFIIGNWANSYINNYGFDGLIDDVRIYDHALSLKEVQELAKAKVLHYTFDSQDDDANNVVCDCSGQDNDAVLVPSTKPTWTSASRLGAGAYSFDGVSNFIGYTPQIISSANELTVAGWIYPVAGGSNFRCALHHGDGTSVGSTRYWFGISSGNKLTATIGSSSGAGWAAGETTTSVIYNQWVHLAASWDGATVRVFINGVFNKSYALTTYQAINSPTRIGASSDGANYQYAGNVDDVRIYATALTDAQVLELYQTRASLDDKGNFYA